MRLRAAALTLVRQAREDRVELWMDL